MLISKPLPGSGHGDHTGWRDVMAREGCPICRATIIPEGTFYAKRYRTFGDMVDGKPYGREKEKVSQYIIWGKGAAQPPKVIHESRPMAIKVAYKLAADNPGEQFYVCKLVGVVEAGSPKYSDMGDD